MDFAIAITDGETGQVTWDKAGTIMNNVYLSLEIDQGSWFQNLKFGSRLYLLKRRKNTPHTAALAVGYCKEALKWLLDTGKATKVEVYTERDDQDLYRLKCQVIVTETSGRQLTFTKFVEVT
jgi:phage gp46-like protein